MKLGIVVLLLLLSSCSYLGLDYWFADPDASSTPERTVVEDRPKRTGLFGANQNNGISIYEQHHRYTFFMKIDRTVVFENAKRGKNEISGLKDDSKLGDACRMQRIVGAFTRDILVADKGPRMFRLMRSVSSGKKEVNPILIAVDVKSGDTTFEIHCPDVGQYNTVILEENFGFKIIPEKNKLKENFI